MFDSEIPMFVHVSRLNRVFIVAHSSNHYPQNWHLYIDKIDMFFFPNIYLSIYIYIVLNHPSPGQEQKRFYSRVLQGHLALATAVFPEGTCGLRLGKPWVKPRTNAEKNMVKKWQTWWSRGVCLLLSWMGFHCLTCLFTIFAENHG